MDTTWVEVTNISELAGSSILGISVDALVSALIAILVFGLGVFFSKRIEAKRRKAHLLEVESYLYDIYGEIGVSVEERIKAFEDLIKQLRIKEQGNIEMEYVSDYSIEFLQEIDWIDYYNVFSAHRSRDGDNNISLFKIINKCVAVIKDVNKLWKESYKELVDRQSEYEKRWHEHIVRIGSVTDDFVNWAKKEYVVGTDPFIDSLDQILYGHQETENSVDLYVAMDSLINPLHTLIKQNQTELWGRRFLDPLMGCIYAYDNYTNNKKAFRKQFQSYVSKLLKADKKLKESVEELRKTGSSRKKVFGMKLNKKVITGV